ncbi:MAG: small basic family protein [Syntrophomonadaceae bacterium]|nr:small basic family protein [Syntrophomonadaceae bacterium]
MWLLVLFCLLLGIFIGLEMPVFIPFLLAKYMSIAILAALDSVFGGIRAYMEDVFDTVVFISGFFVNILLAAGLAYLGDRLGVELYLAAVVAFGVRIFQNLAIIRRYLLKKW